MSTFRSGENHAAWIPTCVGMTYWSLMYRSQKRIIPRGHSGCLEGESAPSEVFLMRPGSEQVCMTPGRQENAIAMMTMLCSYTHIKASRPTNSQAMRLMIITNNLNMGVITGNVHPPRNSGPELFSAIQSRFWNPDRKDWSGLHSTEPLVSIVIGFACPEWSVGNSGSRCSLLESSNRGGG